MSDVLIVAATERELCGHAGLVCGIGPVEAAAATARELARRRPGAVLHVGIAGGRGLDPGTLVIGSEARYADLSAEIPVVDSTSTDSGLVAVVRAVLPDAPLVPITTSATVTTASNKVLLAGQAVEAMEGFAVLRASESIRAMAWSETSSVQ